MPKRLKPATKAPWLTATVWQSLAVVAVVVGIALAGRLALLPSGGAVFGGPFVLQNSQGQTMRDSDFRGRWMLVYFGYTYCPDICPTTLSNIAHALGGLPKVDSDKLVPLFISLDPERDTPALIGDYAKAFSPALIALTGTPDQVAAAAKAYKVFYRKVVDKNNDPKAYTMDHSSLIYLMNPEGQFVTYYDDKITASAMSSDLKQRLE
jgi:protein SCO1/2